MKDERWVLIVLICLIVVLTLIDVGAFTTAKIHINNTRNLTAQVQQLESQIQQQNTAVNSFVSQLQKCKTMKDVDVELKSIGVERIK
jgi:competence protein ComGC